MEHTALECAGIFHANHHTGQQAFKHAGWREVVSGANFFQVDGDGGSRLGAVHHITAVQPLGVTEDVLTNPSGWQIGQHVFVRGEFVEQSASFSTVDERVVRVHDTFGVTCCTRGEEHRADVVGVRFFNFVFEKLRMLLGKHLASREQFFD